MLFSNSKRTPKDLQTITTSEGIQIDMVSQYKYLGVTLDNCLSFTPYIQLKSLKWKRPFYFRIRTFF